MISPAEQRFEALYHDNFRRVASYLLSRSDRELAQDALTRTFEVAWLRIDDVPPDALPWLLGVARKVLADLRRARGRSDALFERMVEAVTHGLSEPDPAESVAERLVALEALRALRSSDREALLLVAWDGLSEQQAARVLGCSRGAFALRLHRARRRLTEAIRSGAAESPAFDRSWPARPERASGPLFPLSPALEEPR
jgi:RNA polymerase sigma-70 factor (ECF subfamily)